MRLAALTRIFFAFLFLITFSLLFKPAAFAQNLNPITQSSPTQQSIFSNTNPDVPKNLHTFTQNVMIEVMSAVICQVSGIDITNTSQGCLGIDPKTQKIGFVKGGGGLIGVLQTSIITLYTPPLHTVDYFKYLASNFGIAKKSYAATSNDLGFNSITPLQNVWLASRNVAYLFFVIIFLIIGIGVMLRIHIDPRTVMTIQNQIPKIIIAIVLVTFSFAIAGLLIDVMYIVSYLLLGIIASSDPHMASNVVFNLVRSTNPFDAANTATTIVNPTDCPLNGQFGLHFCFNGLPDLAYQPANLVNNFVASMFDNGPGHLVATVLGAILGGFLGNAAGNSAGALAGLGVLGFGLLAIASGGLAIPAEIGVAGAIGAVATTAAATSTFTSAIFTAAGGVLGALSASDLLKTVAGVITFLIVMIAILVTLFRLWFQLIMAYIQVLLNIVFAPIWIMLGLIPTSKITFGAWIRNLVGNLSCFPTALVMFLLARVFIDAFAGSSGQNLFVAPLIANPANPTGLAAVIGMGIFLMTPSAVTTVKNAISGSSGITFGGAGQAISAGVGIPMAGIKGVIATRAKTTKPGDARGWKALFGAA